MPIKRKQIDERLLGTWRSDRALTLKYWKHPPHLTGKKLVKTKRLWRKIFGKLTFRITKDRIYGTFGDSKWTDRFRIIAADERGAVLAIYPLTRDGKKLSGKDLDSRIWYLEFREKKHFCVLAGDNVEYFRKQPM